jgi:hypothetical protein
MFSITFRTINILDYTTYLITTQLLREITAFSSYYGAYIFRITHFSLLVENLWVCNIFDPAQKIMIRFRDIRLSRFFHEEKK